MLIRRILSMGILLVIAAAQGAQAQVAITIGQSSVTATGITAGRSAVFFASGLVADGTHQRLVQWARVVPDDDHDGSVTLAVEGGVPHFSIWAVVDLTDGRFALASPPGFYPRVAELPQQAFHRANAGSPIDQFGFDHSQLDLLYVHPGLGVWTWSAVDGRWLDRDGPNGITRIAIGDGKPLGDTHGNETAFTSGGILVAIDWYKMEVLAVKLDGAILGGAQ